MGYQKPQMEGRTYNAIAKGTITQPMIYKPLHTIIKIEQHIIL